MRLVSKVFGIFICGLSMMYSCEKPRGKEPITTESGIKYAIISRDNNKDTAKKAKEGMVMVLHYQIKHKDSILQNTWDLKTNPTGQPVPFPIPTQLELSQNPMASSQMKGTIAEILPLLQKGDSAQIWIRVDSTFKKVRQPIPPSLDSTAELQYTVKIIDIQTKEDYQASAQKAQKEQDGKMKAKNEADIKKYIADNKLTNVKRDSTGLYYVITKPVAEGATPKTGDTVSVHYTGKLIDGKVFDSSVNRGEPIEFPLGQGAVIKGWDTGIGLLKKGEKATLLIPSHIGYGPQGAGQNIPPFAVLIFDVELVGIKAKQ